MTLLTELLDELRHPAVRDLAWTLLAPPLLRRTPEPQRHPLAASRWRQEPERLAAWLREQERQPQHLAAWLAQWPRQRLGLYYEHLWQFALEQAPDVRLIAANLPVRDGGHTLGELDLLLRDDDGIHHLELAIKLYLGPQSGPGDWLGPGGQDRLSRKLEHLCRHQLPLAATREGRQVLAAHGAESAVSALWLSGYLFHPWPGPAACPPTSSHGICVAAGSASATGRRTWPAWPDRRPGSIGCICRASTGWRRPCGGRTRSTHRATALAGTSPSPTRHVRKCW